MAAHDPHVEPSCLDMTTPLTAQEQLAIIRAGGATSKKCVGSNAGIMSLPNEMLDRAFSYV